MISLIVPTHERHTSLLRLINSIKLQTCLPTELIIVSNLKDSFLVGASFQQATQGLRTVVTHVGKVGVNRARNLGLQKAQEPLVLFVDDDCEFKDSHFIEKLICLHEQNAEALAIGGSYLSPVKTRPIDKAYNIMARAWQSPQFYGENQSWRLLGGNLSFKRLVLLATQQLFNEDISFGGTEAELLSRLQRLEKKALFVDPLQLIHYTLLDEKKLVSKAFQQALTHSRFKIDGGFWDTCYQDKKTLWAQESALDQEEFLEILYYMELYNQAFRLAQEDYSLRKSHRVGRKIALDKVSNANRTNWL